MSKENIPTLRDATHEETAVKSLKKVFLKFNEASTRLETKFSMLFKETEELRKKLREKDLIIEESEKMAQLGKMAAALAHEIRNPLGAIKLFSSLLREEIEDNSSGLIIVEHIESSVHSLNAVISNMLQFARREPLKLTPVNVHSVIREQAEYIMRKFKKIKIELQLEGSPFILGSEHALRQAFYNLFLNGVQATSENGVLKVVAFENGEESIVRISDNGPGISTDILPNIFEPFVTSKNEGTGLGLAVVGEIIKGHKGAIMVKNANGAQFILRFRKKLDDVIKQEEAA